MFSFMLTKWTTMRGATSVTSITQSESEWLDLRGFEDLVAWMEVKEVTVGGGTATHVTLTYQSSPTKDDLFFSPIATAINIDAAIGVTVTPVIKANASIPLARWLRYQIAVIGGTPALPWDATFRIWIAANIGAIPRQARAQRAMPPIRQNGKGCSCDANKGGSQPISPAPRGPGGLSMAGTPPTMVGGGGGLHPAMARPPTQSGMPWSPKPIY